MAVFDDDKKKKKKRKKKVDKQPKDKVDKKTGLTIVPEKKEDEPLTDAEQKQKAYEERQKEKGVLKSTTKIVPQVKGKKVKRDKKDGSLYVSGEDATEKQSTTYTRGGKEVSKEDVEKKATSEEGEGLNSGERIENVEKKAKVETKKEEEEDIPSPKGITQKENERVLRNQQKKQEREHDEELSVVRAAEKQEKARLKEKKKKTKAVEKTKKLAGKVLEKSQKGSHVNKVLQARLGANLKRAGVPENIMSLGKNAIDLYNEGLNNQTKQQMYSRGFSSGSGGASTPPIDETGLNPNQIATLRQKQATLNAQQNLEWFDRANPIMKPTDYYPQVGRAIGVGTSTGEIIGSRTIYTGAGVLAPQGLYDARRRALAVATKKGIADADGKIPSLPQVEAEYRTAYRTWSGDRVNELISNADTYYTDGKLNTAGKAFQAETIEVGNNINELLERVGTYEQWLGRRTTTGKGSENAPDGIYYSKADQAEMAKFLMGDYPIEDFIDKDKDVLKRLAGIRPYSDLVFDIQNQDYTSQLLNARAFDKKNVENGNLKSFENEDLTKFVDQSSGQFLQAYTEQIEEGRIEKLVKGIIEGGGGKYNIEQEEAAKEIIKSQLGKQETILTKNKPSASTSAGSKFAALNNSFTGKTRLFYDKVDPELSAMASVTNGDISTSYAKNVGGRNTTSDGTEILSAPLYGVHAPIVVESLAVDGAPQQIGGFNNATSKFAVMIDDVYTPSTADEILDAFDDGKTIISFDTETELKNDSKNRAYFTAFGDPSTISAGETTAVASTEINCMGFIKDGIAVPLNESNFADWKASDNKVQLKSFMYRPMLKATGIVEFTDATGNAATRLKETLSSPNVTLIGSPIIIAKDGTQNERCAAMNTTSDATDNKIKKPRR